MLFFKRAIFVISKKSIQIEFTVFFFEYLDIGDYGMLSSFWIVSKIGLIIFRKNCLLI